MKSHLAKCGILFFLWLSERARFFCDICDKPLSKYCENIWSRTSRLENRLKAKFSCFLIFVQIDNHHSRKDQPPAVVAAFRAENRFIIPFLISGCVGPCRPIQEARERPLPSVVVIRATNNLPSPKPSVRPSAS
jgi:hypothetical protein